MAELALEPKERVVCVDHLGGQQITSFEMPEKTVALACMGTEYDVKTNKLRMCPSMCAACAMRINVYCANGV